MFWPNAAFYDVLLTAVSVMMGSFTVLDLFCLTQVRHGQCS